MANSKIPFSNCKDPENRGKSKTCVCGAHSMRDRKRTRKAKAKSRAKKQRKLFQYMVFNSNNQLYSVSNGQTRKEAIMHHEGHLGQDWAISKKSGDKVKKVRIEVG